MSNAIAEPRRVGGPGLRALLARVVVLDDAEHDEGSDDDKARQAQRSKALSPRAPSMMLVELVFHQALGPMPRAPRQHRVGEHVVEDLEANGAGLLERAQDAGIGQRVENGSHLLLGHVSEVGKIRSLVRDLRARGGHEVVEEPRRDVLLRRRQLVECTLEMVFDDPLSTS